MGKQSLPAVPLGPLYDTRRAALPLSNSKPRQSAQVAFWRVFTATLAIVCPLRQIDLQGIPGAFGRIERLAKRKGVSTLSRCSDFPWLRYFFPAQYLPRFAIISRRFAKQVVRF